MNDEYSIDVCNWNLIVCPRERRSMPMNYLMGMVRMGPVRVIDGSGWMDAAMIGRITNHDAELIKRVSLTRVANPSQMVTALAEMPAIRVRFLVLDMLAPFADETMAAGQRKMLLLDCLRHLERMSKVISGVVSVHPPMRPDPVFADMLRILKHAAMEVYQVGDEFERDWRLIINEANSW
jgi:hypothetical protein